MSIFRFHFTERANQNHIKSHLKEVYLHLVSIVYEAHHNVGVSFVTFLQIFRYLIPRRLRRPLSFFAVGCVAAGGTAHSKKLLRTTEGGEES